MDVRFFLKQRISFIRQLYSTTSKPYLDRKRDIEEEKAPWIPEYREDGEPQFLDEWLEADESLQVLGRSCVSMLAATLHVYCKTWAQRIGVPIDDSLKKNEFKKKGWLNGYKAYFARHAGISFDVCPVNLAILEELILARNQIQHPEQHPDSIISDASHYSDDDLRKLTHPFFVDERDAAMLSDEEERERAWLMPPAIHVTADKLNTALNEVKQFADWLESAEAQSAAS